MYRNGSAYLTLFLGSQVRFPSSSIHFIKDSQNTTNIDYYIVACSSYIENNLMTTTQMLMNYLPLIVN